MKQKLALVCTLIHTPKVLFLDEPTTGVDPVSRREFWQILYGLVAEGMTLLVSTPYMDEADRCQRLALVDKGRLIKCASPKELRKSMPQTVVDLRCADPHKARSVLGNAEGVSSVEAFGERLHVTVPTPKDVDVIPKALAGAGLKWKTCASSCPAWRMPSSPYSSRTVSVPEFEIECRGLTKRFGSFVAVDNISLGVHQGEVFGFLGPNGCGKSTTIRMVCGLLTPTSGQAFVGGIDVAIDPESIKQRIGYMSQKFSLYDDLTVVENLEFFGGIYGLHGRQRAQRIGEVAKLADLESERGSLVAELSTGVRQRLALAASILHRPEILILDEPTSGVDPTSRRRFWDLINDLAAQGASILVTTHAMDEAEHCHNIAMMQSGHIVCMGAPEELKATRIQGEIFAVTCEPLFPALSAAQTLPGVADASVFGSKLHIRSTDANFTGAVLSDALTKAGINVEAVERGDRTLEDVFVAMAGEAQS